MKTLLALLSLCALPLAAQNRYSATTGDVVLAASATTLTIQMPASNGLQVTLETAVVYCSVATNITQAFNGTAATATAGTARLLPPNTTQAATATVWTASNVGAGTAAGGITHVSAGQTIPIDVSKIVLGGVGTGANYSFITSSVTGTCNITLFWKEQ